MKEKHSCPTCGAKMVQYKHTFSTGLATGLARLYEAGKPVNIKTLGLTHYQWANFQKLRYWGLVERATQDGHALAGVWAITVTGRKFVNQGCYIHESVWTYRGKPQTLEGKQILFPSELVTYRKAEDYARESREPHWTKQSELSL